VSSGVEVQADEVIVLGHSPEWTGNLRMGCAPMADALDIGAIGTALAAVRIEAAPQVRPADRARIAAVFVKCEPDRRGQVRGARHTMLDDTDIHAQRHIRGAVGGLVAGVLGDGRIFVSGGAEHQGPDGGGLVAVIAVVPPA
jgi:cyanuric acid amidohydrolase